MTLSDNIIETTCGLVSMTAPAKGTLSGALVNIFLLIISINSVYYTIIYLVVMGLFSI